MMSLRLPSVAPVAVALHAVRLPPTKTQTRTCRLRKRKATCYLFDLEPSCVGHRDDWVWSRNGYGHRS